jgi:hypothetical protein
MVKEIAMSNANLVNASALRERAINSPDAVHGSEQIAQFDTALSCIVKRYLLTESVKSACFYLYADRITKAEADSYIAKAKGE